LSIPEHLKDKFNLPESGMPFTKYRSSSISTNRFHCLRFSLTLRPNHRTTWTLKKSKKKSFQEWENHSSPSK
jgi:hypothetical protein